MYKELGTIHRRRRWQTWPWEPWPELEVEHAEPQQPPGGMDRPRQVGCTEDSIEICWRAYQPMAEEEKPISGYELQVCRVDALDGLQPWRTAYRGLHLSHTELHIDRGVASLRARVRALRGRRESGRGEWSEVAVGLRTAPHDEAPPEELMGIPASWVSVDLAGMPGTSHRATHDACPHRAPCTRRTAHPVHRVLCGTGTSQFDVSSELGLAQLLSALHEHRTTIKVALA